MKRIGSFLLSLMMVMLLVPSAAFAAPSDQADGVAAAVPEFSIEYADYDKEHHAYQFTVQASSAPSESIDVAYRTFRGTTDESLFEPVEAATVTFGSGETEKTIAIAVREPEENALDTYVASEEAKAQKYFGVALVKASAGTISPSGQCATAVITGASSSEHLNVVDTSGMLAADGSGDMVASYFNSGGDFAASMPIGEFNAYPQNIERNAYYTWRLGREGMTHSLELDIQERSALSPYWYAAGGVDYLYSLSYALDSEDFYHVYSLDVDTSLVLSNRGEEVVRTSGDLEAWRGIGEVSGVVTRPGFVPLNVDLPAGADAIKAMTVEEYCAAHPQFQIDDHVDELVNGYENIVLGGYDGAWFVSDEPMDLEGELTLRPTDWTHWHRYDAQRDEIPHSERDFFYEYSLAGLKMHYGVRDGRAPQVQAEADGGAPRVYFSQSEYVKGDTIRISVVFDEIVASYPQGQTARLSVPTAKGASAATYDMQLAGGVGTNVLEFACTYDGGGATNGFVARNCELALPTGLADMAGNVTQGPLTTSASAAFTKAKNVTVPLAPAITAKDAEGNAIKSGGVGYSDITLTFTQPADDPAAGAVTAYEVSLDGGDGWQRIAAEPGADPSDPDRRTGTYTITAKGEYSVVARALVAGGIPGDESAAFAVARYDEGEKPGTFWLEHPEGDFGHLKDKVIVHREGGSVGEQVVTVRSFRVDSGQEDQLHFSAKKLDGADDPVKSGSEVSVVFPSGYAGTREINVEVWAGDDGRKLRGESCVAGVEVANVRASDGRPAGQVDRTRSCAYVDVPTSRIRTDGLYARDPATGGPKLDAGEIIHTADENTNSSLFVYPGETKRVDLGRPFAGASGTDGELDLYYSIETHIERMDWSFAGMYDVTTTHTNAGVELFRGWEDYDNTQDDVTLPGGPININNVKLDESHVTEAFVHTRSTITAKEEDKNLKFFKSPSVNGDAGELSVSLDSSLPSDSNVWLKFLTYHCYGVDKSAPVLKEWGVSDQLFYDGNEARVYLEFSEPVESATVTARIWDKNRTKCYATLSASGPRDAGSSADTLMGFGSKHLMLSGFQDGGEEYMPADALLELEVADVHDYVGNRTASIAPESKVVSINTATPPLPDHVDDDVPHDKAVYGRFLVGWDTVTSPDSGSFTIRRVEGSKGRQEVFFRTLWGTNDPANPFFEPVDSSIVFEEGQKEAVIKINEYEADKGDVGYYSAAASDGDGVKRTYGVEIYDVHGGGELDPAVTSRFAWREAGYAFTDDEPWVADFDGYLYGASSGNTFQRSYCEESQALPVSGYDGHTVLTSFENAANRYFRLTCEDMYTQMHMYQDKEKFEFTADDIWTRIYAGDGSKRELYVAHEDYDNTNHDHCYFPQDVPINSGNTVDDSSYTASVSGKSVDGRAINRVWRLSVDESDVVYNIQGYWAGQVKTEDGWLDYLFVDDVAPRPKVGGGAQGAFYPSTTKLGPGDFFSVTVAFDEVVRIPQGADVVLEVYDASGTVKLGEMLRSSNQVKNDSFDGLTSALCFSGPMPETYTGGTYVLKLAGTVTDMAGNVMDMTSPDCQEQITVESDAILPPTLTLVLREPNTYDDAQGTRWYSQASMLLSGNAANPAGTVNQYSFDGVTYMQGDVAEITGENREQRVWARCVAPNGEQSPVVVSDPIAIDTMGPTMAPVVSDDWTQPPAAIATNARDGGAGVQRVDAKGPGGASSPYGPSQVQVAENGAYELEAVDNLGNVGESATVEVSTIDGAAPPMPGVRSAGASVEVWPRGTVAGTPGTACYTAKLEKSDTFTFVPAEVTGSPERYRYSYALAGASGSVQKESSPRPWSRGSLIPASYGEDGLSNSVSVITSSGIVRGLGVYVYCEDEAGNSRKDLLVLDCDALAAATNVYVEPFEGAFDDAGNPKVSGVYDGGWTAKSVIFSVRPELVGQNGVDDPSVTVERIEYSTDDGATWTDVTATGALGRWRARGTGGSFEIAPSADAAISEQIRFRAVASSGDYGPNASDSFPVNVDGRTPVAVVTLTDEKGDELPLAPAADEFANTSITVSIEGQAAHDATFEMSVRRDGVWGAWRPLSDSCVCDGVAAFAVSQPGISQMKARVRSITGLESAEASFELHIDAHAPKLGLVSYEPASDDDPSAMNVFTLTMDDADADSAVAVSGPKTLSYRIEHPDGTLREGEGVLTLSADGKSAAGTVSLPFKESGAVTMFAIDGAGNASNKVSRYVDESAPELTVIPQADYMNAPDKWYPSVTFDYEATDGIGGLVSVEYTEDGVAKRAQSSSGSFTVSAEGVYDVVITATDASGKAVEERYRVQIVEAPVADVANGVADLPSPEAGKQEVWEARQGILDSVEDYLALSAAQKAKMPLDQLEKLEALYEIVLPLRSVDRLDDPTGIHLIGLLFALDPSETAIPDDYWDAEDYPEDGFVLYELEVKTRDLAEGGMTAEELARVVDGAGFAYQDGFMWDVVVEKRTYAADDAGKVVSREHIGSDRWREGARIVGLFPFADELCGRDIHFVNVVPEGVEEIAYEMVERPSAQGSMRMARARLSHLSYYGFVETKEAPAAGPSSGEEAGGSKTDLPQTGDDAASSLALAILAALAAASLFLFIRKPD